MFNENGYYQKGFEDGLKSKEEEFDIKLKIIAHWFTAIDSCNKMCENWNKCTTSSKSSACLVGVYNWLKNINLDDWDIDEVNKLFTGDENV